MYSKTEKNYKGVGRRILSMALAIALICSFGLTSVFAEGARAGDSGTVDKTALTEAITAANTAKTSVETSVDGTDVEPTKKWALKADKDAFSAAITAATAVANNTGATAQDVTNAVNVLAAATTTFNGKCKIGTKPAPDPTPTEVIAKVSYTYDNSYVSIDTKDTAKASDYFYITARDNKGNEYKVINIKFAVGEKLSEVLKVSQSDYYDWKGTPARFMPIAGKALTDGIYNVAMTGVAKSESVADANVTFNVELHISATDPAYFTVGEAIFNVADLDKPAATLISEPITIKVPSGNEISKVVTDEPETYTVKDGKWDTAKKEYSFKLEAKADNEGKYNFNYDIGIKASFTKQRMAYVPAEIDIAIRTTDTKLAKYVKIGPKEPLAVGISRQIFPIGIKENLPEGEDIRGNVLQITNFISTPADALENRRGSIKALKSGSATFDAETELFLGNLFKVKHSRILWLSKGNKVETVGADADGRRASVYSESDININDPATYKVKMEAQAYGKDGKAEEITGIKFAGTNKDSDYFKAPADLKKGEGNRYTFTLELKNEAKEIPSYFDLDFEVTTASGTKNDECQISWHDGTEPKSLYFTKDGKKITEDTLKVGTSSKYGIVIEGYKMKPSDELSFYWDDDIAVVRGKYFYNEMGTNEQITLRMEKTLPANRRAHLQLGLQYTPIVTHKDVKLTVKKDTTSNFSGGNLDISSTEVAPPEPEKPTPPKPTPPSDNNNNGSSGGTGTPSVDAPSSNVGGSGEVKADDIKAETSKAVADAVKAAPGATANVTVKNADNITPTALKEMATAAAKAGGKVQLMADSVVNGVVESRLYINPALASTLKAPIKLGVTLNSLEIDATKAKFASFNNKIAVASFAQQGSFGMKLAVAIKLDLTELNTKTLVFYSYDKATNKYIPVVAPAYSIDKNGYLHFSTTVGGDIIITDKPLAKK